MYPKLARTAGFVLLPILTAGAIIASAIYLFVNQYNTQVAQIVSTPEATPESTATPEITPTITPTPVSTAKPSSIPAPVKPVSGPPGSGYSRLNVATEVGNFTVSVVSIDMAGVRMITDTANDSDCASDCATLSLQDFVTRNGGFAGINGTYFCPATYPDCASKKNSFDFPVYNTRLGRWINQGNMFWNNRSIIYQDGSGMHFMSSAKSFGGSLTGGLVNHPGLLEGDNVIVDQFPAYTKQDTKGTKGAIGIRGNVVYLVVAGNVTMRELGHIFKSMGASSALNLDGGGSAALWFNGYKAGPGRAIPNAIIFAR